mmetsp:Transcript_8309/g.24582  ORF Transcript_8309/g.24582 Transcript_8309/m.24582 type:complete len:113 (+) Transcript_8309:526-864(+)
MAVFALNNERKIRPRKGCGRTIIIMAMVLKMEGHGCAAIKEQIRTLQQIRRRRMTHKSIDRKTHCQVTIVYVDVDVDVDVDMYLDCKSNLLFDKSIFPAAKNRVGDVFSVSQ